MPLVETPKLLSQRHLTSTGDVVLYTIPTSITRTLIKSIIVCNTTGSATTYSIWLNPSGTSTADAYAMIKIIPLAARASDQRIYPGDASIILEGSGASIIGTAGTASAVTITIFGIEVLET